jgi:Protein of unknown function (DUF3667).
MSEICKNCSEEIALNFCPNCGQKKAKRIDRNYIKDEIQYTVLHMNKGFFYSIKKILKAPGKTAREFVEGNRVNHYKPILLVFVVAGISAFLTNTFIHPEYIIEKYYQAHHIKTPFNVRSFYAFVSKYNAIIMLLTVPFMATFTWITFKKWGYNYYENIIINAYSLVFLLVLSILIVFPIQLLLKGNPNLFMIIPTSISYLLMLGVFPWFYINLYSNKSAGDVILRLLLFGVILLVAFIVLCILIGVGLGIYMAYNNIDPKTLMG